jgi:TetR/AcrR family transcriptional regulator, cholesterol catabolism regulator
MKSDLENLNPSMLFDLQKYHSKAWGLYTEHKVKTISQSVVRNIRKGVEDGFYRPEINPDILAITRLILIEAAFSSDLFPKDRFNFIEVQTQLFDFFVHGLCTEKGKKLFQKYKEEYYQPSL